MSRIGVTNVADLRVGQKYFIDSSFYHHPSGIWFQGKGIGKYRRMDPGDNPNLYFDKIKLVLKASPRGNTDSIAKMMNELITKFNQGNIYSPPTNESSDIITRKIMNREIKTKYKASPDWWRTEESPKTVIGRKEKRIAEIRYDIAKKEHKTMNKRTNLKPKSPKKGPIWWRTEESPIEVKKKRHSTYTRKSTGGKNRKNKSRKN